MRLITLLLVTALAIATVTAYANGVGTTNLPSKTETTHSVAPPGTTTPAVPGTTTTEPTGAGPTTPTTPPTVPTTPPVTPTVPAMSTEVETFNTNFVTTTFGVDSASVTGLRQAGWTWGDIYLLANIADLSGRPILEIANLRSQGQSWSDIASRYNLTTAQITSPAVVETRVAGYTAEFGYQPIYYQTDPWGNPVLTRYDAERLSRMGYDWQSIAIAANIAAKTGARVSDVLAWIDRGYTWPQVIREYGVNPKVVMDVSKYPFARVARARIVSTTETVTTVPVETRTRRRRAVTTTTTMPPTGTGPMAPGMTVPSPPPVY